MSSDPVPSVNLQQSPEARGFERIAADAAARFHRRHLQVRNSRVVHRVGWYRWLGELYLPGPACGTGWAGADVLGELHAVDAAVTCRKCPSHDEDGQMALAVTEPEPELALFPLDEPGRRQ